VENKKMRKHSDIITVWPKGGIPDDFGNDTFLPPLHYYVRYEDRTTTFIDAQGNQVRGRATVHMEHDDFIMDLGDAVYYGKSTEPLPIHGSFWCKDRRRDKSLSGSRQVFRYVV
jgi:hypothetical protein